MFSASDYDKLQQIMKESPEKKEILTRLMESQQMTISSISHEIRNPLTLVYSTLQLIASQHPEVTSFKHWSPLMKDVEYMNQLLEELSVYNNGSRLKLEFTDMDAFFKSCALSFAASVVDSDIEFVSKIDPHLPDVNCDPLKLRQVLLNLLRNAKDAVSVSICPSEDFEGEHPRIALNVFQDHSNIIIKISDNGCGISAEQLDHIFEPFITYKPSGSGLGLAIACRIVQAHSGSLHVSSAPGSTVFTLTLPIQ